VGWHVKEQFCLFGNGDIKGLANSNLFAWQQSRSLQLCDSLIRPLPRVSELSGTSILKAQSAAVLGLSAN